MTREIKIYTSTCHYCKMAKKFLDGNGVKYRELGMAEDKAREEMQNWCKSLAAATICVEDEVLIGFSGGQLGES